MKVGTDSNLLGSTAPGGNCILDIGTGTGVLALMMAQRFPSAQLTAIEIDAEAAKDAAFNIKASPYASRIQLHHTSLQAYCASAETTGHTECFDCIISNPPYFSRSLQCPDVGRTQARHNDSLPFPTLAKAAYTLLQPEGLFTVILPTDGAEEFETACAMAGFLLKDKIKIKTVPRKEAKRLIITYKKGISDTSTEQMQCLQNSDGSPSEWYRQLMEPFLL